MNNDEIKEILELHIKHQIDLLPKNQQEVLDYITNLQQENERLKTKTKEQSLLLIDYQDMEQKLEDYKSRIEKAVEWLITKADRRSLHELIDILNGRSDE